MNSIEKKSKYELPKMGEFEDLNLKSTQEKLEFRFNQSRSSRLAEYITGLRPNDPRMGDRLIEDQKIIRAKYGLPPRNMRFDEPGEYEHILNEMAKKNNTLIKDKSECSKFFETYPIAGGVYMEETNSAIVGVNRNDEQSYIKTLGILEHELIHAEQRNRFPGMPTELFEYEAYLVELNVSRLKQKPEDIESVLFGFFINGSVGVWYRELNKNNEVQSKPKVSPVWENPEFFLKNIDGISQEDIDEYKNKMTK